MSPAHRDVDTILTLLSKRHSCREFDSSQIDVAEIGSIIEDGIQAPSSCNHQNWHFIAVTESDLKERARAISGGNHHFEFCSVLIYLCFQKGWTHDKFSIVQSVAGACYHMMLSAHLRGYATIWNAGIGDPKAVADMLGIPPTFEIQGALCIGRPKPTAPQMKAPRRPQGEVWSMNTFARPAHATYPAKPATAYPFFAISNARNPFAEWCPQLWGWERISDFRGYAVWAKSPIAGVYRSRRQGETTTAELRMLPPVGAGSRVVDVMPWGGTHTTELLTSDDWIARFQNTALHQHRCNRAATFLHRRFDHDASGKTFARRPQLEHVRLQQDLLEKIIDAFASLSGDIRKLRLAAPVFSE